MDRIENRGRGLLKDRTADLGKTLAGIRTGEHRPTSYMKGQLILNGYIEETGRADRGTGNGRGSGKAILKLTRKGNSIANLHGKPSKQPATGAAEQATA